MRPSRPVSSKPDILRQFFPFERSGAPVCALCTAAAAGTVLAIIPLLVNRDSSLNTPKTLTVCIVGAEPGVVTRFSALLEEQRKRLDTHWHLADYAKADLLVVDTDSLYGHMDWLKACATGRLVASWSSASEAGDAQLRLPKPIVVDELVTLLNFVNSQLNGSAVKAGTPAQPPVRARPRVETSAAVQAAEPTPSKPAEAPRAAPAHTTVEPPAPASVSVPAPASAPVAQHPRGMQLIDLLETDSPLKGRLRLVAADLPTLWLDPHHRTWHTESTLKSLSAWCTRELSSLDVQSVDDAHFPTITAKMPGQPYARLKWLAHLVHGEGRLDPDLDVNARYKLARWPQSEREFPKHFRIATMMLKQAASLDEIAAQAGATIGDVADFINAYHAIGYIEQDQSESTQDDARRGGLFGRNRKVSTS